LYSIWIRLGGEWGRLFLTESGDGNDEAYHGERVKRLGDTSRVATSKVATLRAVTSGVGINDVLKVAAARVIISASQLGEELVNTGNNKRRSFWDIVRA
jgi:hypothetical protein